MRLSQCVPNFSDMGVITDTGAHAAWYWQALSYTWETAASNAHVPYLLNASNGPRKEFTPQGSKEKLTIVLSGDPVCTLALPKDTIIAVHNGNDEVRHVGQILLRKKGLYAVITHFKHSSKSLEVFYRLLPYGDVESVSISVRCL